MIGGLGPVFDLAQAFVDAACGFPDGFCKKLRIHKVGAGTGGQITAVLYQLQAPQVDFTVTFDCIW